MADPSEMRGRKGKDVSLLNGASLNSKGDGE